MIAWQTVQVAAASVDVRNARTVSAYIRTTTIVKKTKIAAADVVGALGANVLIWTGHVTFVKSVTGVDAIGAQ